MTYLNHLTQAPGHNTRIQPGDVSGETPPGAPGEKNLPSNDTVVRDSYGQITHGDCLLAAEALIAMAHGKIPAAFDDMDWGTSGRERGRRVGSALNLEVYDVNPEGTCALVCAREVLGTQRGVSTVTKNYFVIARHGLGVSIIPANKALVAKVAKASGNDLGVVIEKVTLGSCK